MTRKKIKGRAGKYVKYVEWSDEDQCFIERCPEVFSGAVHGSDEANVYEELCETVEEWIEILRRERKPLPPSTAGRNLAERVA